MKTVGEIECSRRKKRGDHRRTLTGQEKKTTVKICLRMPNNGGLQFTVRKEKKFWTGVTKKKV